MELGDRKLRVLHAVIDDYINVGEPVGSRTIVKKYNLGVSSATVRNEMADLEEMGYLVQPHTSSGRIPSDKAYRLYVDQLMQTRVLTSSEANNIKALYAIKANQTEEIISQTAKILSDMTNYTSVVLKPQLSKVLIRRLQIIPLDDEFALLVVVTNSGIIRDAIVKIPAGIEKSELERISNMLTERFLNKSFIEIDTDIIPRLRDELAINRRIFNDVINIFTENLSNIDKKELYLYGTGNIFNFPEYRDLDKARSFLDLMDETEIIYDIVDGSRDTGVSVTIGSENKHPDMKDSSIVTATYYVGDRIIGTIGLIGPTRMEYSNVFSIIDYMGKALGHCLTRFLDKQINA